MGAEKERAREERGGVMVGDGWYKITRCVFEYGRFEIYVDGWSLPASLSLPRLEAILAQSDRLRSRVATKGLRGLWALVRYDQVGMLCTYHVFGLSEGMPHVIGCERDPLKEQEKKEEEVG